MFRNRLFDAVVVVALVVMAALTVRLAIATPAVVSGGPDAEENARPGLVDYARSYRDPLDECFDVPLSEAASCAER